MTTVRLTRPTWRAALRSRTFTIHYLQMLAAMLVGMAAFMPLSALAGDSARVEVDALLMATSMTAGMTAWMAWRRHAWPAIAEMALAMYLSFALLFPPYWAGALSAAAMALAMLHRREEHLGTHHTTGR